MADEFQSGICSGNWWNSIGVGVGNGGVSLPFSTASNDEVIGSYGVAAASAGWPTINNNNSSANTDHHQLQMRTRSSDDSAASVVSGGSSTIVFQDTHKPQESDSIGGGGGNSILMDSTLQMMGFGLSSSSSPSMDWNPSLLNNNQSTSSGRSDHNSFRCMLQEDLTSSRPTHRQDSSASSEVVLKDWSPKNFSNSGEDSSPVNAFKQISHGFSLDPSVPIHTLNSSTTTSSECTVTCDHQGLPASTFPLDTATLYGSCPSSLIQGLFEPDNYNQTHSSSLSQSSYPYFVNSSSNELSSPPSWIPKLSQHQFLMKSNNGSSSPQKQQPRNNNNNQLHISNDNASFWNASTANAMTNARSTFFPSQQIQFLAPSFEGKPNSNIHTLKHKADGGRNLSTSVKKSTSSTEPSFKRPRMETPSSLPTFKVRKEKLGDRITALQQLVSPFGKTDTASVLFEAIEYIKFLHEQVSVLSAPYLKNGADHIQHQQIPIKTKEVQGSEKDLRSQGLCLVPISSTFPVTNETATDFWTPTFGGTYR